VSELTRDALPPAKVPEVQSGQDANSLNEALGYVESLRQDIKRFEIGGGVTTTVPSTVPVTATVPSTSAAAPAAPNLPPVGTNR